MINIDNIFSLFNDYESDKSLEPKRIKGSDVSKTDYKKSSEFKIGMFIKIIENSLNFNKKVSEYLRNNDPGYNDKQIANTSNFVVYNRAYYYLNQVNTQLLKNKRLFKLYANNNTGLITYINLAIKYFETIEEYEKCAHLLRVKFVIEQ